MTTLLGQTILFSLNFFAKIFHAAELVGNRKFNTKHARSRVLNDCTTGPTSTQRHRIVIRNDLLRHRLLDRKQGYMQMRVMHLAKNLPLPSSRLNRVETRVDSCFSENSLKFIFLLFLALEAFGQ